MHAAHVTGVAAIATAVLDGGRLENGYRHAGFPRHQGCAQRGIATSNNRDIRLDDSFNHAMQSYIISANWCGRIALTSKSSELTRDAIGCLTRRLKVLVAGLPEQECELPREVLERHDLLFREVAVIVVDLQQHRLS